MAKYIVILITAKNRREASKIADGLIKNKLAACVNIVGDVKSIFPWEGKIDRVSETLLIVKSRRGLFKRIVKAVKLWHSYSVPEIIALPIVQGHNDYLNWVGECTKLKKE